MFTLSYQRRKPARRGSMPAQDVRTPEEAKKKVEQPPNKAKKTKRKTKKKAKPKALTFPSKPAISCVRRWHWRRANGRQCSAGPCLHPAYQAVTPRVAA